MALEFKPDWEEAKERYKLWWKHEDFGRCAIAVTAPKDGVTAAPAPRCPATPLERWTDLDYAMACNDYHMRRTYYGGEAFPVATMGYPGHMSIPTFLGCPLDLDFTTGWWQPIVTGESLEDVLKLRVDPDCAWWQFSLKATTRLAAEAAGRYIPSIGAFGASGDTLAAIRGSERLLLDVVDRPGEVQAAEDYLMQMWFEVYDTFYDIVHEASQGSTCWFELWSPGKFYGAQNDFSYMISPRMFRDIFLPTVEKQVQFLDHTVYHDDGIGSFAHVPALCELPELQAIQIHPGDGKPSPLHYMEVLKQVQQAGKNLQIWLPAQEVEAALHELSSTGLFISTSCSTEAEARELLRNAEKWSRP